ncbi:hypothetical protein VNI00_014756 [Paramarasmius palmivorus]|uniref:Transmembrane protein n=1 Tax=Paramarasmius palmivorus TaxID=297713 RepID=A0AAW0BS18_9AGAR
MSSSQEVTLIADLDNSSALFTSEWQFVEDPAYYGGTAAFSNRSRIVESLEMRMSFRGTSISFYGIGSDSGCWVTLDRNNPASCLGPDYKWAIWYQSPSLPDEEHNIVVTHNSEFMYIDYALVKAGSTTDLSGKTIFVDNARAEEIWYTGQWLSSLDPEFSSALQDYRIWDAAARTATQSNTIVHPTGTSISVYGILLPAQTVTLEFIVDGTVQRREFSKEDAPEYDVAMNYKFYENMTLSAGNHFLIVNVSNILEGSTFWFDYITYTPSFSFVNERPTFIRGSSTVSPKSLPIGAIVGIIIAGLLMVTCVGVFYYVRTRRSASVKEGEIASRLEPFTIRAGADSKSRPTKWREFLSFEEIPSLPALMDEQSTHPEPLRIQVEVKQRNYEIASLTAEMQNSDNPTRGELFARINMLTMEVERLVRENAPPEYAGSDGGQRPSSRSGTLPSYDDGA